MKTEWTIPSGEKVKIPNRVRDYFDLDKGEDKALEWEIDEENDKIIVKIHELSEEEVERK